MPKSPRYVIVRTNAGFHVRLIGGNAAKVQWSETYTRVARARRAVELACLAAGRADRPSKLLADRTPVLDEREAIQVSPAPAVAQAVHPGMVAPTAPGTLTNPAPNFGAGSYASMS